MTCGLSAWRPLYACWLRSRPSASSTMCAGPAARCGGSGSLFPRFRPVLESGPTHYIAMLAFSPGIPIAYNIALTGLSLVAAIFLTGAGLAVAVEPIAGAGAWLGGAMVGGGIAAMHYTGMAALEIPARIVWDPVLVAVSIALGGSLARPRCRSDCAKTP